MLRRLSCAAVVGLAAVVSLIPTAQAQTITQHTPNGTVSLVSDPYVPTTFVSTMKMDVGNWTIKPIYRVSDTSLRVVGLFAFAKPGTVTGSNLTAVWYQRGEQDCDPWTAVTWEGAKPWDAVVKVKEQVGIPDVLDQYWEVDGATSGTTVVLKNYDTGFTSDNPIGQVINTSPDRDDLIAALKEWGDPVADLPFEKSDPAIARFWLANTARFFDHVIGLNLSAAEMTAATSMWLGGPDWIQILCDIIYWPFGNNECTPEIVYGEWTPTGQVCNCTTEGPWCAMSGKVKADAHGKIKTWIPYPPPRGTTIEIEAGVGAEINLAICVWVRKCTGSAERTRTQINADCSKTTLSNETKEGVQFSDYFWRIASSEAECHNCPAPDHCPPNTQPCDLRNP